MAINMILKIVCFDVKVIVCLGTGHHTVIVSGFWETAHLPLP